MAVSTLSVDHPEMVNCMRDMANLRAKQGMWPEALHLRREVVKIQDRRRQEHIRSSSAGGETSGRMAVEVKHFVSNYLNDLQQLSLTHFETGEFDTARKIANDVVEMAQSHLGAESFNYIWGITALGDTKYEIGEYQASENILECAIKLGREHSERDKDYIIIPWILAITKTRLRKLEEAKGLIIECVEVLHTSPDTKVVTLTQLQDWLLVIQTMEENCA